MVIIFSLFIILATLTTNVACNLAAASVVFSSLFGKVLTYKKGRRCGHDPLHLLPALETG